MYQSNHSNGDSIGLHAVASHSQPEAALAAKVSFDAVNMANNPGRA
jgi:hypothetical protein